VIEGESLYGIVTMSDVARAIEDGISMETPVSRIMTTDVVKAPSTVQLFEVIRSFKERDIGRLIVMDDQKPVGILTQSDIIKVFPSF